MTQIHANKGFGLIELLVTLAVVTMVISIGIPSYENFVQRSRAVARVDAINAALRLARQVAVEHNRPTFVCSKSVRTLADGSEACGSVSQWDQGLLVKLDDGSANPPVLMNKTFTETNVATSIYKTGLPSATLNKVAFLTTGNLNPATTGPAITITVNDGSCIGTTSLNIAGRSITEPLQGC